MLRKTQLRYKQYGFYVCFKRYILLKIISLIYRNYENLVLTVPNHKEKLIKKKVKLVNEKKLSNWKKAEIINDLDYNRYHEFITTNCIGYYIEIENHLAAIGFVQTKGTYKYGSYLYALPEKVHMLKNLYVRPNYRGLSLGKKINEARINAIPEGCIPCVFVIPENKYAIRNLKLYGFQDQLKISHTSWFKKYTYTRLQLFQDNNLDKIIIKGFKTL